MAFSNFAGGTPSKNLGSTRLFRQFRFREPEKLYAVFRCSNLLCRTSLHMGTARHCSKATKPNCLMQLRAGTVVRNGLQHVEQGDRAGFSNHVRLIAPVPSLFCEQGTRGETHFVLRRRNLPRPRKAGERAGVRGRQIQNAIEPPLTLTLSPTSWGRGNGHESELRGCLLHEGDDL